jgi:hypothetical protein
VIGVLHLFIDQIRAIADCAENQCDRFGSRQQQWWCAACKRGKQCVIEPAHILLQQDLFAFEVLEVPSRRANVHRRTARRLLRHRSRL